MDDTSDPIPLNVLIVDDEINIRKTLAMCLEADGHRVVAVSNVRDAVDEATRERFDLAFVDLRLGQEMGMDLIPQFLTINSRMRIVIITAHGSIDSAVDAIKRGGEDYLTKPFTPAQVRLVTQRLSRVRALEQKVAGLQAVLDSPDVETSFGSDSPAMQRVLELARQLAANDATVLIRGESGTGKSLLAKAIHSWSPRSARPFTIVSCPTLSPQLLESELFGHARGAFTGAVRESPGRLAASEGGTLMLDEIGDLPIELQPKLLRFVQDREYERVGEAVTRRADVRVITATNVNLEDAVRAGRFREDLLYRIKVVQLDLPPLRQRTEDIVPLAERFLAGLSRGRPVAGFNDEALAALRAYEWPGNIRELRNAIERAVILGQGGSIGPEHLPRAQTPPARAATISLGDQVTLEQIEEIHIRRVLARCKSLDEAAGILGIDVATLWRRRRKYKM